MKRFISNKYCRARGYFVRTVGIDKAQAEEYVRRQIEDDRRDDGDSRLELRWEKSFQTGRFRSL